MAADPFETLDEDGVGELIKLAMARGHNTRPGMKMGICGEHGGDPTSIDFCQRTFCIRTLVIVFVNPLFMSTKIAFIRILSCPYIHIAAA